MNQSFVLHVDNETTMHIPCEEIMFLSAVKANQLTHYCSEVFIIQVTFTTNRIKRNQRVKTIVRIQAIKGEYTGYSYGNRWEEALTRAFENILQQFALQVQLPAQNFQPSKKEGADVLHHFSEN